MVADTSGIDGRMQTETGHSYGTIVVCGGGCYGGYYVRQLARARRAGALTATQIVVVDRDPACRVARLIDAIHQGDADAIAAHGWSMQRTEAQDSESHRDDGYEQLPIAFVTASWDAFFLRWFADCIRAPVTTPRDAVVPSPLMPNLLADWVASRLTVHRSAAPQRVPVSSPPDTPWARTGTEQSHYASFATWMCPINCIEPPRCPETRAPRDWTMPAAVRIAAEAASDRGTPYDVIALFQTTHRAFGVGMFDVANAVAADRAIADSTARPVLRTLVASVSHCHGALAELVSEETR